MNVNVPKKVLNRKLRKRRRVNPTDASANDEPIGTKQPKLDTDSDNEENEQLQNGDASNVDEIVPAAATAKSSILTDIKFTGLKGKVADRTLSKIKQMGFKFMTEIQSKAIGPLLEVGYFFKWLFKFVSYF